MVFHVEVLECTGREFALICLYIGACYKLSTGQFKIFSITAFYDVIVKRQLGYHLEGKKSLKKEQQWAPHRGSERPKKPGAGRVNAFV